MPTPDPASRTGSFPTMPASERPSPVPPPNPSTPEWFSWATRAIQANERAVDRVRSAAEKTQVAVDHFVAHFAEQIGRPPIPASKDPGAGMWLVLADVRTDCTAILAKLDAQDKMTASRGSVVGKMAWEVTRVLLTALVLWAIAFFSGHWRW